MPGETRVLVLSVTSLIKVQSPPPVSGALEVIGFSGRISHQIKMLSDDLTKKIRGYIFTTTPVLIIK